jgi:carbon storage regulator
MLVLKRRVEEDIVIDGRIIVKVLQINGGSVRLGVLAPTDVPIHRGEVWEALVDAFPLAKQHQPPAEMREP